MPNEIANEVTASSDLVADWLKGEAAKSALRLDERADVASLRYVGTNDYAQEPEATKMQKIKKIALVSRYSRP